MHVLNFRAEVGAMKKLGNWKSLLNSSSDANIRIAKTVANAFGSDSTNDWFYFTTLGILVILGTLTFIPTTFFNFWFCIRAARKLHDVMFHKLLRAPLKFFNSNAIGN